MENIINTLEANFDLFFKSFYGKEVYCLSYKGIGISNITNYEFSFKTLEIHKMYIRSIQYTNSIRDTEVFLVSSREHLNDLNVNSLRVYIHSIALNPNQLKRYVERQYILSKPKFKIIGEDINA